VIRRTALFLPLAAAAAALLAGSALAHADLLPREAPAQETQLFTLAVPNEKDDAATTKVVLTVPEGFSVDQLAASPGWTREAASTGTGEGARLTSVTWTADGDGNPEGGLFQFTGSSDGAAAYRFEVEQEYSDGSVVDWAGDEGSDTPAPVVETKGSPGGDGTDTSTLAIVALVVAAAGVLLAGLALAATRKRPA
jgi:uncharacterized protein YcnI